MTAIAHVIFGSFLLSVTACAADQPPPTSITVDQNRATVRGVVEQNVKRCDVNGPCYLLLSVDGSELRVYYHQGEAAQCANDESTRTGLAIVAGDVIEAVGLHSLANRTHIVDVCCPECRLAVVRRP